MAKGFGVQLDQQLGYVLVLMPEVNAYAAKFSLDFRGEKEPFIGVVNSLEDAQVWKTLPQARKALIKYYEEFLIEQKHMGQDVQVQIKRLKRLRNGQLKTELVETLEPVETEL